MLFLPEQAESVRPGLEKIDTYLTLSRLGCPVLKSALIQSTELVDNKIISVLRRYFKTEEVTVRYQYVHPTPKPVQGGNRYPLHVDAIAPLQSGDWHLWIMEPVNRLKNQYGINLSFRPGQCRIEIVGQGFDVADLNRGQVSPHQTIITEQPVRMGAYNEWWKFLNYWFTTQEDYMQSVDKRKEKLSQMDYTVTEEIFLPQYRPLPMEQLEKLLEYVSRIGSYVDRQDFCVSCSIIDNHFVFWDIQTPEGKKQIYGVNQ